MVNNQKICECCGQPIIDYKVTLTKRNLIWMYALGWLGKHENAEKNNWTNYKDVHTLVAKHFGKEVDGKWRPMVVTSYGRMSDFPWSLIENDNEGRKKFKSKGDWRLTAKGIDFINNKVQVPEIAYFRFDGCYDSNRLVYAKELKGINFAELTDLFNSF